MQFEATKNNVLQQGQAPNFRHKVGQNQQR